MKRRRRTRVVLVVLVVIALTLLLAATALASAGGGSAGYGGGGEGGGGRGFALYILIQLLIRIAVLGHGLGALVLIGIAILYVLVTRLSPAARGFTSSGHATRRRTTQRQRRVERAAAEAAEYDPVYAADIVKPAAARLFTEIQAAWDAGDKRRLATLVAPDLMVEWERRLDDFARRGWRNRVAPLNAPRVEYVGLTRHGDNRDRVVVRIEARLRDYVEDRFGNHLHRAGRFSETVRIWEFWTLARRHGRWVLVSIEQGGEGSHALDEQVVATPWSDETKLRDEALLEGVQAVPEGTTVAEVADLNFQGDARAGALDLSLADGRFAPDVLEVAARRAVSAWAEAVDGEDTALREIADRAAVSEMLHPGDPSATTRLVVRGPRVKQINIVALDAGASPPTMTIDVEIAGRRYIEHRATTAVLSGSPSRETTFTERLTLALSGDERSPWRIVSARG